MKIARDAVEITDFELVSLSIPKNLRKSYEVVSCNNGEYFAIRYKKVNVAIVKVLADKTLDVSFLFQSSAKFFQDLMEKEYSSKKIKDELRWVVLVAGPDHCWERISTPEISKSNALDWIGKVQDRNLMVLVSFIDDGVNGTMVRAKSANYVTYVDHKLEVDKSDMGAIGFQVSNWEG